MFLLQAITEGNTISLPFHNPGSHQAQLLPKLFSESFKPDQTAATPSRGITISILTLRAMLWLCDDS